MGFLLISFLDSNSFYRNKFLEYTLVFVNGIFIDFIIQVYWETFHSLRVERGEERDERASEQRSDCEDLRRSHWINTVLPGLC